jgi:hypothetical protein
VEGWKNRGREDGDGKCFEENIEICGYLEGSVFRFETGAIRAFNGAMIPLLTVHESPTQASSLLKTLEIRVP